MRKFSIRLMQDFMERDDYAPAFAGSTEHVLQDLELGCPIVVAVGPETSWSYAQVRVPDPTIHPRVSRLYEGLTHVEPTETGYRYRRPAIHEIISKALSDSKTELLLTEACELNDNSKHTQYNLISVYGDRKLDCHSLRELYELLQPSIVRPQLRSGQVWEEGLKRFEAVFGKYLK